MGINSIEKVAELERVGTEFYCTLKVNSKVDGKLLHFVDVFITTEEEYLTVDEFYKKYEDEVIDYLVDNVSKYVDYKNVIYSVDVVLLEGLD